ncbi:MAG: nucleotidyltransferase [Bacteroidetes bacterium]|nr:nucleotidyltransferase [Bacteroidota bacterium]
MDKILLQICTQIQITKTQRTLAETAYHCLGSFLSGSSCPLSNYKPSIYSQGSFKIQTTNRPMGQEEFDLDFVCELKSPLASLVGPDHLLSQLYDCIKKNPDFSQTVEIKKRCVRMIYPKEFHIDIIPAIPDLNNGGTCILVPDRELHKWTESNPIGYADWFESNAVPNQTYERRSIEQLPNQEPVAYKKILKVIVQLLKRARDVAFSGNKFNGDHAPASIVLTTLATEQFHQGENSINQGILKILSGILFNINNTQPDTLRVLNPTNPNELFSEQWEKNPESYRQFTVWIETFIQEWSGLLQLRGLPKIHHALSLLFGEDVTRVAISDIAEHASDNFRDNKLGILPSLGLVKNTTHPDVIPFKPNTFYGDNFINS